MKRPCPECGGPLPNQRAERCRACRFKGSRQANPPGTVCADCGGPVSAYATRCKTCANRTQAIKAEQEKLRYFCSDCGVQVAGKPQRGKTGRRCRPCHVKYAKEHPPNPKGPSGGPHHPKWKGGRFIGKGGYVYVWVGHDQPGNRRGYMLEHRAVMEGALDRRLLPEEVVHHLNGVRDDNRPENLEVVADHGAHLREHHRYTGIRGGGTLIHCPNCQTEIDLTKLAAPEAC